MIPRGKVPDRKRIKTVRVLGTIFSLVMLAATVYVVIVAGSVGLGFGKQVSGKVTDGIETRGRSGTSGSATCYGYIILHGHRKPVEVDGGCGNIGDSFTTNLPLDYTGANRDRVYFSESWARTKAIGSIIIGIPLSVVFALMAIFPRKLPGRWKFKREDRSWVQAQGEAPVSAKDADFQALGMSYRKGDGQDGEVLQEVMGSYRGCSLFAMCETRWVGYQGTTYGDGGRETGPRTYRSMLRVCIDITPGFESESVIVYRLVERGPQYVVENPSKFDKFYRGIDVLRSENLVYPDPAPTGNQEFDATFGINCDSDLAARIMTPDLLTWIAKDPRSAHFRIMVYGTELSVCFLGPIGYQPDDIVDPAHIFPAADYLIELAGHVSPQVLRPAPAAQPAAK